MNDQRLRKLLGSLRTRKVSVEEALEQLKILPYEDLGFASIDHHRLLRQGLAEVVYCEGKTKTQIVEIIRRLRRAGTPILATRAAPDVFEAVRRLNKRAKYHKAARVIVIQDGEKRPTGNILILTAGTSDIPVAEEARVTGETLGSRVYTAYDVGVAGLHRLLDKQRLLQAARVLIVVAGMDGVLPSVVGGLTDKPLIAVPTHSGYGASFGGVAALLTMLNSCAAGVAVVNIDNGFGAAVLAHRINVLGNP
jgi:pyridinium-3,5-biscarboxylic acid mononucleotide synthase